MALYDSGLHLLLDDMDLFQVYRVRRVMGELERAPAPVLESDMEWEKGRLCQMWGSVLYDGKLEKFRAWYLSYNNNEKDHYLKTVLAYAESDDGVKWTKPHLGIYSFKGDKNNNIVMMFDASLPVTAMDGGMILDERDLYPEAGFTFVGFLHDERMWARHPGAYIPEITDEEVEAAKKVSTHYLIRSGDGIHWNMKGMERLTDQEGLIWSGRDIFRLTRDEKTGEYISTVGVLLDEPCTNVRAAALRKGKSIKDMGEFTPYLLLDEDDGYGAFGQFHFPGLLFNYGNQYVGLLDYISDAGKRISVYLLSSRDGKVWNRIMREKAFIPPGKDGAWDADMMGHISPPIPRKNYAFDFRFNGGDGIICALNLSGNPPILKDDKLFFYYTVRRVSPELPGTLRLNPNTSLINGIGVATIPRDRFAGLSSVAEEYGGEEGFFITTPVKADGKELYLNVSIDKPDGWVKVELKDGDFIKPSMKTLAGFSLEESVPITLDSVRTAVKWKEKRDIKEINGKEIALKVVMHNATVYAYGFK